MKLLLDRTEFAVHWLDIIFRISLIGCLIARAFLTAGHLLAGVYLARCRLPSIRL
jgi:hypothetical protein